MQLVCFSCAGGTAQFYQNIKTLLSPEVSVSAVEYSGHGTRGKEPLYDEAGALAQDAVRYLKESCDGKSPYAMMGYSMGCLVLLEVYRMLREENFPLPVHVFLAAHYPEVNEAFTELGKTGSEEAVKKQILTYGQVPDRLINNRSFWRIYMPTFRADLCVIGSYRFREGTCAIQTPATVFYAPEDTCYERMKEWKRYLRAGCEFRAFEGNHFFIKQHEKEIAEIIRQKLTGG